MVTEVPQIPIPPVPTDPPAVFGQKASDAFDGLYRAIPKINQAASEIEQIGQDAGAAKVRAIAEADAAMGYRNEAVAARDVAGGHATTATDQAVIASAKAAEAAASALSVDPAWRLNPTGVQSINGGQLAGHRNKLINPFTENQRSAASAGDDTYCVDRWYILTESGVVAYSLIPDPEPGAPSALRITQPDAIAKRMGVAQIIEAKNIRQYRNAAMNFSARVKASFSGNVRYAIIEHTGASDVVTSDVVNNWASTSFTSGGFFIAGLTVLKTGVVAPGASVYGDISDWSALGASTNNVIVFVWTEAAQAQNATLEINRPQYEPGVVKTPCEWRLNELQMCQQYFEPGVSDIICPAYTASVLIGGRVKFKVTKRANPSITIVRSYTFNCTASSSVSRITKDSMTLSCLAVAAGGVQFTDEWQASCEL